MPKHKKTREQKKKADARNAAVVAQGFSTTPLYTFSQSTAVSTPHAPKVDNKDLTTLVRHDLAKTAIVSLGIVVLQVIFFILLKNHMLAINFVRY